MSYSEFEACVDSDGIGTCRVLPQFLQYIGDSADTVATSMSTTTSTAGPPVFTTVSLSSTPSPFPSSSNLPVLRTFVKKEGLGLVKKVAKSASDGLGDLSKKTLDSVIESEAFSDLFDFIVDFLPAGLVGVVLILVVVILALMCYNSKQQARVAAATIEALADVVVVKKEPGIILFLFYMFLFCIF